MISIFVLTFSCICGTSSSNEEVPELSKFQVLQCREGSVLFIFVSANSSSIIFLHLWYLLL